MNEKEQKALDILARIVGCERDILTPEQDLVGDLGLDSPKALLLLCDIEEECGVEIPDDCLSRMDTVGELLDMVRSDSPGLEAVS